MSSALLTPRTVSLITGSINKGKLFVEPQPKGDCISLSLNQPQKEPRVTKANTHFWLLPLFKFLMRVLRNNVCFFLIAGMLVYSTRVQAKYTICLCVKYLHRLKNKRPNRPKHSQFNLNKQ